MAERNWAAKHLPEDDAAGTGDARPGIAAAAETRKAAALLLRNTNAGTWNTAPDTAHAAMGTRNTAAGTAATGAGSWDTAVWNWDTAESGRDTAVPGWNTVPGRWDTAVPGRDTAVSRWNTAPGTWNTIPSGRNTAVPRGVFHLGTAASHLLSTPCRFRRRGGAMAAEVFPQALVAFYDRETETQLAESFL
ncbi:MAG TPA: hypothetical protein VF756_12820 [Thermoanaerobaculia bacterium]